MAMAANGPAGGAPQGAPAQPAPVSGPGALSQRTDGGPQQAMQQLGNAKYGEQKAFSQAQAGAPMAAAPSVGHGPAPTAFAQALGAGRGKVTPTPFSAPTQRPGEPVTAGAARGAGPGTEALNLPPSTNKQDFAALRPALPALQMLANLPGATPGVRQFVRYLQSGGMHSADQAQGNPLLQAGPSPAPQGATMAPPAPQQGGAPGGTGQ